jgi:predicted component of type VI protein secretion system
MDENKLRSVVRQEIMNLFEGRRSEEREKERQKKEERKES